MDTTQAAADQIVASAFPENTTSWNADATTCSYYGHTDCRSVSGSRSRSRSRSSSHSNTFCDSQATAPYSPVLPPGKRAQVEDAAAAGHILSLSWHLPIRPLQGQPWQSLADLCRVARTTPDREPQRQLQRQISDATTVIYERPAWSVEPQISQDSQDQDLSGF